MKHASNARGDAFDDLVDSIDDLLQRISDLDGPEINKIRTKVQIALSAAKSAWQDTTHYAGEQVTNSLRWPGEQMREAPWRARQTPSVRTRIPRVQRPVPSRSTTRPTTG